MALPYQKPDVVTQGPSTPWIGPITGTPAPQLTPADYTGKASYGLIPETDPLNPMMGAPANTPQAVADRAALGQWLQQNYPPGDQGILSDIMPYIFAAAGAAATYGLGEALFAPAAAATGGAAGGAAAPAAAAGSSGLDVGTLMASNVATGGISDVGAILPEAATASTVAPAASVLPTAADLAVGAPDLAAMTAAPGAIGAAAPSLGSSILTGAGRGAITGGVSSAVRGGDPLTGALTGAVTGGVGGGVSGLATPELGTVAGRTLGGAAAGATGAALGGGNVGAGLAAGAAGGVVSGAGQTLGLPSAITQPAAGLAAGATRQAVAGQPSARPSSTTTSGGPVSTPQPMLGAPTSVQGAQGVSPTLIGGPDSGPAAWPTSPLQPAKATATQGLAPGVATPGPQPMTTGGVTVPTGGGAGAVAGPAVAALGGAAAGSTSIVNSIATALGMDPATVSQDLTAAGLLAGGTMAAGSALDQANKLAQQEVAVGQPALTQGAQVTNAAVSGQLTPLQQQALTTATTQGQSLIDQATPLNTIAQQAFTAYASGSLNAADALSVDNFRSQSQQGWLAANPNADSGARAAAFADIEAKAIQLKDSLMTARLGVGMQAESQWLTQTATGQSTIQTAQRNAVNDITTMFNQGLTEMGMGMQPVMAGIQQLMANDQAYGAQVTELFSNVALAMALAQAKTATAAGTTAAGKPAGAAGGGAGAGAGAGVGITTGAGGVGLPTGSIGGPQYGGTTPFTVPTGLPGGPTGVPVAPTGAIGPGAIATTDTGAGAIGQPLGAGTGLTPTTTPTLPGYDPITGTFTDTGTSTSAAGTTTDLGTPPDVTAYYGGGYF
jgi:hypothetical protein